MGFLFLFLFFFPILFICIGVVGMLLYFNNRKRNQLCTASTTGKVIEIVRYGGPHKRYRQPRFQYFVNGRAYTVLGYSFRLYPVGAMATIYYNPSSPGMAHTEEKNPILTISLLFFLAAFLYIIIFGTLLRMVFYLT